MKHYIIAAPNLTAEDETALASWLPESVGWWHHVPGAWILVDPKEELDVTVVRNWFTRRNDTLRCMVLEVRPGNNWSGRLSQENIEPSANWLETNWDAYEPADGT